MPGGGRGGRRHRADLEGGEGMILIKGMEMPFICLACDFHKCAGGVGDFCSLTKKRQFRFKNRPEDCPLVSVVRCKDCRFWESEHSYCPDMMRRTEASGFCAWGERKDDE